jgi:hypothetical protein
MTPTPWRTPRYNRGASFLDWSSPWSCSLGVAKVHQLFRSLASNGTAHPSSKFAYRILTVSKPCVTVTAPQAATPPAMKALQPWLAMRRLSTRSCAQPTHPSVVDMAAPGNTSPDARLLRRQKEWRGLIPKKRKRDYERIRAMKSASCLINGRGWQSVCDS